MRIERGERSRRIDVLTGTIALVDEPRFCIIGTGAGAIRGDTECASIWPLELTITPPELTGGPTGMAKTVVPFAQELAQWLD